MLGTMFDAGHAGFGGQMQGAMDQMWQVNQANQNAALTGQALGGRGGAPQQPAMSSDSDFHRQLMRQQMQANNDMQIQQRQNQNQKNQFLAKASLPQYQGPLSAMFGFGGFGGGASPFGGSTPNSYSTNYGASGSYTNPAQQQPGGQAMQPAPYSMPYI